MSVNKEFFPKISVLIAARNEEENILECLMSVRELNYPLENIEVWIGNDQSEDKTGEIVQSFCLGNNNFHLVEISENLKHLKGKPNVLAQLIKKARGEYLFVTDADAKVSKSWVKGLLENFHADISMVSGVTVVEGNSLFSQLQNAECIFFMANGHINSNRGQPVSAIGSNMAFTRSSYLSVGGYENIPFSVTEDYELFKNIIKAGGKFKTAFGPEVLVYTKPVHNFRTFLHQRRRWLTGAFRLPKKFAVGLFILWTLLPILLLLGFFIGWKWALALFALKWTIDLFFMKIFYNKLNQKLNWGYWLYTPYSLIFNTIILLFYLVPAPVVWKGREYSN